MFFCRLNAGSSSSSPAVPVSAPRPSSVAQPVIDRNRSGDIGPPEPGKNLCMMGCFVMNTGVGLMVATNGALAVGHKDNSNDADVIFIGIYMVIFAAILMVFEVLQLCPVQSLDNIYKRNFGFLYGVFGKCFYLLL